MIFNMGINEQKVNSTFKVKKAKKKKLYKYKTSKTWLNGNANEINKRFQFIITQQLDMAIKW